MYPDISFFAIFSRCLYSGHLRFAPANMCLNPDHPLFVYIFEYVFLPSTSLICPLSTPVFISGQSSTRHICTVLVFDHSLSPHYTMCSYPIHHLLTRSTLCSSTATSVFCALIRTIALSTICQLYSVLFCSSATPLRCLYQDHRLFIPSIMF